MGGVRDAATDRIRTPFRSALRIGIAGLMLGPGVSKFLTYKQSIRFFRTLALPVPEIMVLVVGTVEIVVAVLLLFDRAPRASAVTAVPVMIVAIVTAGPTWQNLGVLIAALLLIGIDTTFRGIVLSESTM